MASKLLVVLVRDVKLTQIQDDQLKLVFDYILGIRQYDCCSAGRFTGAVTFPISGSLVAIRIRFWQKKNGSGALYLKTKGDLKSLFY